MLEINIRSCPTLNKMLPGADWLPTTHSHKYVLMSLKYILLAMLIPLLVLLDILWV